MTMKMAMKMTMAMAVMMAMMVMITTTMVPCCVAQMTVSFADGDATIFTVSVNGAEWLQNANTAVHVNGEWFESHPANTSSSQPLLLQTVRSYSSHDAFGAFAATACDYLAADTPVTTIVKIYTVTSLVVFDLFFPEGAADTSLGEEQEFMSIPSTLFPWFTLLNPTVGSYTVRTFWRMDVSMKANALDGFVGGLQSGMPLALYDQTTLDTIVLSSANNFKTLVVAPTSSSSSPSSSSSSTTNNNNFGYGIHGRVKSYPPGFRVQTLLTFAAGSVSDALMGWGDLLLQRYNKPRYNPRDVLDDPARSMLSYYTGGGAYYWYLTIPGLNYEETMVALKDHYIDEGVPVRVFEFDSWFYYHITNSTATNISSPGGIWKWEARPDVFPSGVGGVQAQLQTPLITHAKYFTPNNYYQEQQGQPFIDVLLDNVNATATIPLSSATYEEMWSNAAGWGVVTIKADWLASVSELIAQASFDTTTSRDYLRGMSAGVAAAGIRLQYCMPFVSDIMSSVENAAVTSMRISGDYTIEQLQWKIGQHSLYAWALGYAPFKDNFWSEPIMPDFPPQPGDGIIDFVEDNPELQVVVSVLSTAGVGFADKIEYTNASLLAMACASDGTILTVDKPATIIDAWFLAAGGPVDGEVWHTYVSLQDGLVFHYVFAFNLTEPFLFSVAHGYLPLQIRAAAAAASYVVYDFHNVREPYALEWSTEQPFSIPADPQHYLLPNRNSGNYSLFTAFPVLSNGFVLLGELGQKIVAVSPQRFSNIVATSYSTTVAVHGAVGEVVVVLFSLPQAHASVVAAECLFPGQRPAWWGAERSSINITLIAGCDRTGLCICNSDGSGLGTDPAESPSADDGEDKPDPVVVALALSTAVLGLIVILGAFRFTLIQQQRPYDQI